MEGMLAMCEASTDSVREKRDSAVLCTRVPKIGTFSFRASHAPRPLSVRIQRFSADGVIKPYTSSVYPLADAPDAFRELAERRATGKVLIDPTK